MGICKLESFRYECDRCGETAEFADNLVAAERSWLQFPPIDGLRVRVLCPTDATKLERFLMGDKTGAGMNFNEREEERWLKSCGQR
jgi:hypothetical protein